MAVLSASHLRDSLSHAPGWWDDDPDSKHNAIFVIAPATADSLLEELALKPAYEKAAAHGQVIFWSAAVKTFSRTGLSKTHGTPACSRVTVRKANTAKKLLELSVPQSV